MDIQQNPMHAIIFILAVIGVIMLLKKFGNKES